MRRAWLPRLGVGPAWPAKSAGLAVMVLSSLVGLWATPVHAQAGAASEEPAAALAAPRPHHERERHRPRAGSRPSERFRPAASAEREGDRAPTEVARNLSPPRPGAGPGREERSWSGPRVELSYQRYRIADWGGGGGVHGFGFGGYFPTGALRLGGYGELALRDYSLGQDDVLLRGTLLAGYQLLERLAPVVPYVAGVGTVGVLLAKRFRTSTQEVLRGAGLEAGLDLNLHRNLWVGLSFSWVRVTMGGLSYDLWQGRVRIGL